MSESKHTPGPWHANTPLDERYAHGSTIRDHDIGRIIAVVHDANGSTIANAHLVAAAPDLLQRLEHVAEYLHFHKAEPDVNLPEIESILADIDNTIAKAKGGVA